MKPTFMFLLFSAAVGLLFTGEASAARITVLAPAANSYVETGQLNLVLAFPDNDVASLQVAVAGQNYVGQIRQVGGAGRACLTIGLQNGLNRVEIRVVDRQGAVTIQSLPIYLRSRLSKQYQNPPPDYQRFYFHLPANEAACSACHRMEAQLTDLQPERFEASPCYVCHKQVTQALYQHRPVAAGACFSCHEVVQGKRKYVTRQPVQQTCFVCHNVQARQWKGMKVHHGPAAVGNCVLCHDPHGSDWPSFVAMHPTDLCLNCHQDKQSGAHVIAGFFAKGHPVRAASNPLRQERPFSCAGCHNPHAGDSQNLLNRDRSSFTVYCQSCHKL